MKPILKIGFVFQDILIITRNTGACTKNFGGNDIHTVWFDIHRHPDVSTLD